MNLSKGKSFAPNKIIWILYAHRFVKHNIFNGIEHGLCVWKHDFPQVNVENYYCHYLCDLRSSKALLNLNKRTRNAGIFIFSKCYS